MTVSYSQTVATAKTGIFLRLLWRWKGGVYRLIWKPILTFVVLFTFISILYRTLPRSTNNERFFKLFEKFCIFTRVTTNAIPLNFILGLYISLVVRRWWQIILNLPLSDSVCTMIAAYVREPKTSSNILSPKKQSNAVLYRRIVNRYLSLSSALCFQNISKAVKFTWPETESLLKTGLLTEDELSCYRKIETKYPHFNSPLVWAVELLRKAKVEGLIYGDRGFNQICKAISKYWTSTYYMFNSDWVSLPLVYYQVVAITVYAYFFMSLFARQFIENPFLIPIASSQNNNNNSSILPNITSTPTFINEEANYILNKDLSFFAAIQQMDLFCSRVENIKKDKLFFLNIALAVDIYFPLFTILELSFYLGWFKVADSLFNPFGMEDDNFEIIQLINRNLHTGYLFSDYLFTNSSKNQPDIFLALFKTKDLNNINNTSPDSSDSDHDSEERNTAIVAAMMVESCAPTELPCHSDLRRAESKFFFTGAAARLESQLITSSHSFQDAGDFSLIQQRIMDSMRGLILQNSSVPPESFSDNQNNVRRHSSFSTLLGGQSGAPRWNLFSRRSSVAHYFNTSPFQWGSLIQPAIYSENNPLQGPISSNSSD